MRINPQVEGIYPVHTGLIYENFDSRSSGGTGPVTSGRSSALSVVRQVSFLVGVGLSLILTAAGAAVTAHVAGGAASSERPAELVRSSEHPAAQVHSPEQPVAQGHPAGLRGSTGTSGGAIVPNPNGTGSSVVSVPSLPTLKTELNDTFCSWYAAQAPSLDLPTLSASNVRSGFASFLAHDVIGASLFQEVNAAETEEFAVSNQAVAAGFLASNATSAGPGSTWGEVNGTRGAVSVLSAPAPDSQRYFLPATSIQGNDIGEWVYVSVNYYTVNLYLFQVTYGEHDTIDFLFEGPTAQTAYNNLYSDIQNAGNILSAATGVVAVLVPVALYFALPTGGLSLAIEAAAAAVLTALAWVFTYLAGQMDQDLNQLYESTYANEPSGSQYLELYLSGYYYYPWVTLVGTLASSIGLFGYLSNGNSVTILANYPTEVVAAATLSSGVQNVGGQIGWNTWADETLPSVQVLSKYGATPWENGWSYTFSFTVPSGVSHVLFVYTFNDDEAATVNLPSVLTSEVQFGTSTGIALGTPAPGTYSASFSAGSGWVNTVSIVAYGISSDAGFGYQFGAASQAKSLTLPSGGVDYLGVMMTGGMPITSDSLSTVTEDAASPPSAPSGITDLIGLQSSNTLSFSTSAVGYGVAGVAIIPEATVNFVESGLPVGTSWSVTFNGALQTSTNPFIPFQELPGTYSYTVGTLPGYASQPASGSVTVNGPISVSIAFVTTVGVQLLGGYAASPDQSGWAGYTLSFTVPAGDTHELFFWSIDTSDDSMDTPPLPTLPAGLVVQTEIPFGAVYSGAALGALAPGGYSVTCTDPDWTVYAFSMAVYGVSNDFGFGYEFGPYSTSEATNSFTLPSGGPYYFGVFTTQGQTGISSYSLTTIGEGTPNSNGLDTTMIGWQTSPTVSFKTSTTGGYDTLGVALLPLNYVTFSETGLPSGDPWSVTIATNYSASSFANAYAPTISLGATGATLTIGEPVGPYSYEIVSSTGYMADPSTGGVSVSASMTISVAFQAPVSVQFLNGYHSTPDSYWGGTSVQFTVTSSMTQELILWAASVSGSPTLVTLPSGMTIETSYFYDETGIALGSLAAGTYTMTLNTQNFWTNTATIAVYGISGGANYGFQFQSHQNWDTMYMAQGAGAYLGILTTGGGYPVESPTITNPNEETPSTSGGETSLIGEQPINMFSFWTNAGNWGIAGVAIFTISSVSFTETGLPAGTSWSVTFNGATLSSTSPVIVFEGDPGTYSYTVGAVSGYTASPSSGSVALDGPESVSVAFTA